MKRCKYYSKVVQIPGSKYFVDNNRYNTFKEAIKYIQYGTNSVSIDHNERRFKKDESNNSIKIVIYNDNPKPVPKDLVGYTIVDSKDLLCRCAGVRTIYTNLYGTEIYFEYFELPHHSYDKYYQNYLYDYTLLYSDTRPLPGIYMSNFFGSEKYALGNDSEKFYSCCPFYAYIDDRYMPNSRLEYGGDVLACYICYPYHLKDNNAISTSLDYGIPQYSIPISTFSTKIGDILNQ